MLDDARITEQRAALADVAGQASWVKADATKVGYEIGFTRHFWKPAPLRTLAEIRADILVTERGAEGLLDQIIGAATS